ncbi:MAG: hypothetical protein ACKVOQ_01480 [Cyclobacteriaceae bacterium]
MELDYKFSKLLGTSLSDLRNASLLPTYLKNLELEQVGNSYYLTNKQIGVGFVFDENRILSTIHLHGENSNGYNAYPDELPCGIDFKDNDIIVHKKTGLQEFESGGGEQLPILGKSNLWRKYYYTNCYLHLRFGNKGNIILITLSKT